MTTTPHSYASQVISKAKALSLDELTKVVDDLEKKVGSTKEWVLMSPSGQVWRGTVEQLTLVMAANHSAVSQMFTAPDPAEPTAFVNAGSLHTKPLMP